MLKIALWFNFFLFASALKQWYQIPNHDEEIFVNNEDEVSSFDEAKRACQEKKAINLILYKKPVVNFLKKDVLNFKRASKKNASMYFNTNKCTKFSKFLSVFGF